MTTLNNSKHGDKRKIWQYESLEFDFGFFTEVAESSVLFSFSDRGFAEFLKEL